MTVTPDTMGFHAWAFANWLGLAMLCCDEEGEPLAPFEAYLYEASIEAAGETLRALIDRLEGRR